MSNVLLIPGIGRMSFAGALRLLAPYSPRLAYNFIDPLNSLFQGTTLTPVTAVTNPVRIVIDQTQGGLANLGAELVTNGGFDTDISNWINGDAARGTAVWSAGKIRLTTAASAAEYRVFYYQTITTVIGKRYLVSVDIDLITSGTLARFVVGTSAGTSANFNPSSISVDGQMKGTFVATATTTFINLLISTNSPNLTVDFDNVTCKEIPGNHATASSDAKRPLWNEFTLNNRTVRGAVFDGSDDCLQVAGFDLSDTDEVTVIAGVRKLSDAAGGFICELSASTTSNTGSFHFGFPGNSTNRISWRSRGSISPAADVDTTSSIYNAPFSGVIIGQGKISSDISRLLANGVQVGTSVTDQGSGNYRNDTLNIGGRNNAASNPFNGYYHYLFICGAIVPDEILTRIYRGLGPRIGLTV